MSIINVSLKQLRTSTPHETWGVSSLFLFRTLLLFVLIGERDLILELVSISEEIMLAQGATTPDPYVLWFGQWSFGVDLSEAMPTTKDKLYSWVHSAAYLSLSGIAALVWTFFARNSKAHPLLKDGLWTLLRMFVAFYMFGYGCAKLYGVQFTSPTASQMMAELGTLSRAHLLKVFMGTSQPYSLLGGYLEIMGGILLCYRRTTLLGAVMILGVMSNVVALNLFYSFGMKRFSLELMIFSLIILLPYLRQLIKWGLLNKAIEPISLYGPWTNKKWRWLGTGMMSTWMVVMLSFHALSFRQFAIDYVGHEARGELDGTWEVIEMSRDGVNLPPVIGDAHRWRSLSLEQSPVWSQVTAHSLDGKRVRWRLITKEKTLELRSMTFDDDLSKTELKGTLYFTRPSPKHLNIKGDVEDSHIEAKLLYRSPKSFKLLSQPIHLID